MIKMAQYRSDHKVANQYYVVDVLKRRMVREVVDDVTVIVEI